MVDVEDFVASEQHGSPQRAHRSSQVSWATIRAIEDAGERHSAKFWALVILLGVRRELTITYSRLREDDGWVRVSSALLPGNKHLPPYVKRDAVAILERAGLVEVRRSPHASPRVRLLSRKHEEQPA